MKHVIIGTAGHVDHGKTSLIAALTGTNTDRLKEEQERGMTIDIGFASLTLPDGTIAGIVDVPGHERFVKNMLAGASGVDVALLVIAADEGIMPQTREHLDILKLLNVSNGVIALTKCDIAERDWIDIVESDIREVLASSFLAAAPIIRVSNVTRKGIDLLKKALLSAVSRTTPRSHLQAYRLPVDRVFTRAGFGTVVTGTLVSGTIHPGDPVSIMPQNHLSRVRGLQVHGQKVAVAEAGTRVAINLAGIDVQQIERGSQVVAPGTLVPTRNFDASVTVLAGTHLALKHRDRVRIHIGTDEIIGRVLLIDGRAELSPGAHGYIQFLGERFFAAMRSDRIIIRTYSPAHTVAGGVVIDSAPCKHKRFDAGVIANLEARELGTSSDKLLAILTATPFGLNIHEVKTSLGLDESALETAISDCITAASITRFGDRLIDTVKLNTLSARMAHVLSEYHAKYPLRSGMQKEELRSVVAPGLDSRAFGSFLNHFAGKQLVRLDGSNVGVATFSVRLNDRQEALLSRIEQYYFEKDLFVPEISEVSTMVRAPADAVSALLKFGTNDGRFAFVTEGVYYSTRTLNRVKQLLREFMKTHNSISVGEFRDLTSSNRKFSMQALEYLDTIRFTRRQEDRRTLA